MADVNDDLVLKAAEGVKAQRSLDGLVAELVKRNLARKTDQGIELASKGTFEDGKKETK